MHRGAEAAFAHRHLLGIEGLSADDIDQLLDLADGYFELNRQADKKRNLRSPSHERSIRLMEDQFVHFPVRAEMELYPEALKLVDDERSGLVGTEFVGWLAANCQRELSIVVLPDNSGRASVAKRAGAVLTEGRIRAIAAWNAGEDDIFDQRLERRRQTRNVSFAVGGK